MTVTFAAEAFLTAEGRLESVARALRAAAGLPDAEVGELFETLVTAARPYETEHEVDDDAVEAQSNLEYALQSLTARLWLELELQLTEEAPATGCWELAEAAIASGLLGQRESAPYQIVLLSAAADAARLISLLGFLEVFDSTEQILRLLLVACLQMTRLLGRSVGDERAKALLNEALEKAFH